MQSESKIVFVFRFTHIGRNLFCYRRYNRHRCMVILSRRNVFSIPFYMDSVLTAEQT